MACPGAKLAEGMKVRRARLAKEPVPRVGPNSHDTGEARFKVAKFHRAQQSGEVSAERPNGRATAGSRVYVHDQKDCSASERRDYRLRNGIRRICHFGCRIRIGFHRMSSLGRWQNLIP
jgi:hypothetical protein